MAELLPDSDRLERLCLCQLRTKAWTTILTGVFRVAPYSRLDCVGPSCMLEREKLRLDSTRENDRVQGMPESTSDYGAFI